MESTPDNCVLNPEKPANNLTAAQLADILGTSTRTIGKMAADGKIPFETVNGRGDRRFFIPDLLSSDTIPEKYRTTLFLWKNQQDETERPCISAENPENLPSLSTGNQPARIEDILKIPNCCEPMDSWRSLPETCQDEGFRKYKIVEGARKIKARVIKRSGRTRALERYAIKEGVNPKTLPRWIQKADRALSMAKDAGESDLVTPQIKALASKHGKNRYKFRAWVTPDGQYPALFFALSAYLNQRLLNKTDAYKEAEAEAGINGWPMGSYRSFVSITNHVDKTTEMLAREGSRKTEAARIKKILRNYEEIPPNFMWCGDHHIFDVFVKVPDSKGGWTYKRPWVTAWMDMRSRSFMGWVISFNPNSQTIAMALAHGISPKNDPNFPQCGLCLTVLLDNGKDYRSNRLNGEPKSIDFPEDIEKFKALGMYPFYIDMKYDPKEDVYKVKRGKKELVVNSIRVGGVFSELGIGRRFAIVYHPWAKPIERAFRNVVQSFSRRFPGWCGSRPDQRPEKLAAELKSGQLLTFEELTAQFYDYITNVYHKRPHRGHGMNNRPPDEVFQSLLSEPKKVSPELLDFALAKKERVKIHNWGFVINGKDFQLDIPSNLYGGHVANNLIGEWARVCYDYDFKTVRVFKNGKFVCNGKPLQRASFVTPNCPVMVEGLKLQAYQKKDAKAKLKAIHAESEANAPVSESQALLGLTSGLPQPDRGEIADATEQGSHDDYIPIDSAERYQIILEKISANQELSASDVAFKNEYEKSEEFQSYGHLFTGTMG